MSALQQLARRPAFPELVRQTRLRAGLTQQELADLSALSVRAVRDLEAGRVRRPRRDTVRLLAGALRLDPSGQSEFLSAAVGVPLADQLAARTDPPTLLGREAELAILLDLLLAGDQRLISVVGLPGMGKTRLVDEISRRAIALGWLVGRAPEMPAAGGRVRLLVLDPVSDSPDDPTVAELAELSRREPTLRMLLCTTAPLGLPGERVLPLAGLPVARSAPADLIDQPAVALFVSHARRARPDRVLDGAALSAIAEICRLLDGVPAAIGNAADWSLVLSWQQLLVAARQDPLSIAEPPAGSTGPGWRNGVLAALRRLGPEPAALLAELAGSSRAWTLEALCRRTGRPPVELAKSLHALTLAGLLGATRTPAGESFGVPRLVHRVLRPS